MLKFHRIPLLTLVAVFLASAAGVARYAADSCTQSRMYRQLAAQTEKFPDDAVSTGNNFLPQYQALYAQNSDLAGWIQIDGTSINYPVMQSKHDPDFYLKHNFEKADSPHGCPYVQANCDLQTPSDNILVYGHNMKDGTMFSDLLQYKRESFWEQHRIIRFDTLTAQAEYTVMAVFRGEAEDLFDSWGGSYGYYIQIDHGGGLETLYAHCSSICVTTGQQVQAGQVIGYVGQTGRVTGSHLHLETRVNGSRVDSMQFFS